MFGVPIWLVVTLGSLWLALSATWVVFAIRGLRRACAGATSPWTSALAQISAISMLMVTPRSGLLSGAFAAAFPPVHAITLWQLTFFAITGRIALYALPLSAITAIFCLRIAALRPYTVIVSGLVLLASSIVIGEHLSRTAICASASEFGMDNVTRNSFLWSVANTGFEFQSEIHAMARRGEDYFGWSYSEMDWYALPDTVWINISSGAPACRR